MIRVRIEEGSFFGPAHHQPSFLLSSVFIFIRPFGLLLLRRGSRHNLVVSSSICQEMYYNHISLSIRHHIEGASGFHQRSLILAAYIRSFLFIFLLYLYRKKNLFFFQLLLSVLLMLASGGVVLQ